MYSVVICFRVKATKNTSVCVPGGKEERKTRNTGYITGIHDILFDYVKGEAIFRFFALFMSSSGNLCQNMFIYIYIYIFFYEVRLVCSKRKLCLLFIIIMLRFCVVLCFFFLVVFLGSEKNSCKNKREKKKKR